MVRISDKPFATTHEEPIELTGMTVDVVVHHGELDYQDGSFWNGQDYYVRRERTLHEQRVYVEGSLNTEQLLALYLALKQEEDRD